jgi:hypothetical protein
VRSAPDLVKLEETIEEKQPEDNNKEQGASSKEQALRERRERSVIQE